MRVVQRLGVGSLLRMHRPAGNHRRRRVSLEGKQRDQDPGEEDSGESRHAAILPCRYPNRTLSIEIEPPSKPSTGNVTGSPGLWSPIAYTNGR